MTTKKSWWEDDDEDEEAQSVKELDANEGALIPLDEINRKAERGAALGSVAALISIRALKASQMQEVRIEALEKVEKPEDKLLLPDVVPIGHFEMKTSELLDIPEKTLERILDCAQETLDDPDFGTEVNELLQSEEFPELVAAETAKDGVA